MPSFASRSVLAVLLLLGAAFAAGGAWLGRVRAELDQPFDRHAAAYAGSATCRSCHQDHYASWHRTYHRTMTQEASAASVQGAFDGQIVDYWGVAVRPVLRDGRHVFEFLDASRETVAASIEVKRTVGSHRYQQYLAQLERSGDNFLRLPLLWHNGDQRWVHINGAFLYDDAQHYNAHVTTWNHNCIFCHNTGPEPRIGNAEALYTRIARGEVVDFLAEARYASAVAELGIACEACHGPGAEHAARNRDILRRYVLHLGEAGDPTIVNPRRLDAVRAAEVCGQCHGQRLPARTELVEAWLRNGPTFRPGDELAEHVRLVMAEESAPGHNPDLYRLRFWSDGTPRLSAYELQGLMQSKCFAGGELGCMNCHDAHGGDVNGMMRSGARGNAPCLACHDAIAQDLSAHTHHAADSSGSQCYACHMPKMVYGVMEIHRSHRIESPAPLQHEAGARPDACSGCHLDRSAAWAQDAIDGWRGDKPAAGDDGVPANLRALLGGDPVQRAVAAKLAGRTDAPLSPAQRAAQIPALIAAMQDPYPAVRRFAWMSLRAIHDAAAAAGEDLGMGEALAQFDFIGAAEARAAVVSRLRRAWNRAPRDSALDDAAIAALRAQASHKAIHIGE